MTARSGKQNSRFMGGMRKKTTVLAYFALPGAQNFGMKRFRQGQLISGCGFSSLNIYLPGPIGPGLFVFIPAWPGTPRLPPQRFRYLPMFERTAAACPAHARALPNAVGEKFLPELPMMTQRRTLP
ncbi:MAG: hypothetical protein ACKO2G_09590 [Verrucomicrobiales bacterium]